MFRIKNLIDTKRRCSQNLCDSGCSVSGLGIKNKDFIVTRAQVPWLPMFLASVMASGGHELPTALLRKVKKWLNWYDTKMFFLAGFWHVLSTERSVLSALLLTALLTVNPRAEQAGALWPGESCLSNCLPLGLHRAKINGVGISVIQCKIPNIASTNIYLLLKALGWFIPQDKSINAILIEI